MMKKTFLGLLAIVCLACSLQSCDDTKTYAEKLDEEKDMIDAFIAEHGINLISEKEFLEDTITNVANKEYVVLTNGLYLQIVKRYDDTKYASFDEAPAFKTDNLLMARYIEYNMRNKQITQASNVNNPHWEGYNIYPDGFRYTDSGDRIYGQFIAEPGLAYFHGCGMGTLYGSASVPEGWLAPLRFLRNGAQYRIIVPSKLGNGNAMQEVYPCFYDMRSIVIDD